MTRINFSLGAPFAPFEQLLAVLPSGACAQHVATHPQRRADARVARSPASSPLLPEPHRRLMLDPSR
jgi:hypothetical protein